MPQNRMQNITSKIFQAGSFLCKILFTFCITYVLYEVFFYNTDYPYNKLILAAITVAGFVLLFWTRTLLAKWTDFLNRYFPWICGGYLLIMFLLQMTAGLRLRFTPFGDMGSVYDGAVSLAETGSMDAWKDYFYYFPNNLGLLSVLKGAFSFGKAVGFTDYFLIGILLGSLSLLIMMFSIIIICKKLLGTDYAVLSMLLMALCLPFYFSAAAFYSDVMSMAAPALFYLLYLYSKEKTSWKKKLPFYLGMAFTAGIGMEIKITVVIIVIAVAIEMLLKENWKHLLLMLGIQIAIISGIFAGVNSMFYPNILDKEQARLQNTPLTHWIMMGAQGNGNYNPQDYEFTRSYQNPEEREKAIEKEIMRRYQTMGLSGYKKLLKNKTIIAFGDGTYGISDFLDDGPICTTALHDYILYESTYYGHYRTFCQGIFIMVFLFMLLGGIGSLRKSNSSLSYHVLTPGMAFLGLWIFLMLWEVSARYFSNYISILLLCAMLGIKHTEPMISQFIQSFRKANR